MKFPNPSRSQNRKCGLQAGNPAWNELGKDALDRMVARLTTQRACLDFAATRIAGLPGPVLELGLGKGRTYDRIRRIMPDRDVFVFDNVIHCPVDLHPPSDRLFLGDFRDTLVATFHRLGQVAAMVHADFGSRNRTRDACLASEIAPLIERLVVDNGLLLSDRRFPLGPHWRALELPPEAARTGWPYFIWTRLR